MRRPPVPRSSSLPVLAPLLLPLAAAVALGLPAHADAHRDAVEAACVNDGGGASGCACLADRYEAEMSDAELAFYARLLSRSGDASAMAAIADELGLSAAEVGAAVRRQRDVDTAARRACGFGDAR